MSAKHSLDFELLKNRRNHISVLTILADSQLPKLVVPHRIGFVLVVDEDEMLFPTVELPNILVDDSE